MAKKQKKKSDKPKGHKGQKKPRPKGSVNWEWRILVCLLSNGHPMTASQMQGELKMKNYGLAFKILKKLKEENYIEISEQENLGPTRVFFAPTITCLYYTAFLEYSLTTGKTVEERISKNGTFKKFDRIVAQWLTNTVFLESLSKLVNPNDLTGDSSKSVEVLDAMKEYGKAYIRYQTAYEEIKNDLPDYFKNLIGAAMLTKRDPKLQVKINGLLYKHIIPFRGEADSFVSRVDELSKIFAD